LRARSQASKVSRWLLACLREFMPASYSLQPLVSCQGMPEECGIQCSAEQWLCSILPKRAGSAGKALGHHAANKSSVS
jgi:hypothetical protein